VCGFTGYVSRARENAPQVRVGASLHLQAAAAGGGKWRCEALLGKGNWASVYLVRSADVDDDVLKGLGENEDKAMQESRKALKVRETRRQRG